MFGIEVISPVDAEHESLPEAFTLQGSYPNPFQQATQIVIDLPWSADVAIDVLDVMGRLMLSVPFQTMTAGWNRSINLDGFTLPSGMYFYRIRVGGPAGVEVQVGRFIHFR